LPREAVAAYDRALALQPNRVDALNNRGVALMAQAKAEEALISFNKALAVKPDFADALSNRGVALKELGRKEEALSSFEQALRVNPEYVDALNNLGLTLNLLDRPAEALEIFERALAIKPDFADALNNRGNALHTLRRTKEALEEFDKALRIKPNLVEALNNRGGALHALYRLDEAVASFDRALKVDPNSYGAYCNRGSALLAMGKFKEAFASYEQALAIKPGYSDALFGRALGLLLTGEFAAGWDGYERRWEQKGVPVRKLNAAFPEWNGEDLSGKRIIVYREQGIGDVIQFARYLPLLADRCAQAVFLVQPGVRRLLTALGPKVGLSHELLTHERYDYQCALLSLPRATGTTLGSIPADVPYLAAEPGPIARWAGRIGSSGLRIGVCWQGNPESPADVGRSFPLRDLRILGALRDVRLISLQRNHGLDQLRNMPKGMKVETLSEDFDAGADAFVDTAAVMTNLDLVITADTSIAHLAGALGRPVWVALKHVPDWRWLLDRSDSPWYPTMRLYRQKRRGEWTSVFERMAADVRKLLPHAAHGEVQRNVVLRG
jgi:tetratricopeptide (TPR) repeat protein